MKDIISHIEYRSNLICGFLIFILDFFILTGLVSAQYFVLDHTQDSDWNDCVGVPWIMDHANGFDDNVSLRSGCIEVMGISAICRSFLGPGDLKFEWRTDSQPEEGLLLFLVDGVKRNECSSNAWTEAKYSFRSHKVYAIEWLFLKKND